MQAVNLENNREDDASRQQDSIEPKTPARSNCIHERLLGRNACPGANAANKVIRCLNSS